MVGRVRPPRFERGVFGDVAHDLGLSRPSSGGSRADGLVSPVRRDYCVEIPRSTAGPRGRSDPLARQVPLADPGEAVLVGGGQVLADGHQHRVAVGRLDEATVDVADHAVDPVQPLELVPLAFEFSLAFLPVRDVPDEAGEHPLPGGAGLPERDTQLEFVPVAVFPGEPDVVPVHGALAARQVAFERGAVDRP